MRVVVTGGAGFIGSHVVEELERRGHSAVVLDDMSTGKRENLSGASAAILHADIAHGDALHEALSGADAVIHLAAKISVPESVSCLLYTSDAADE